RARASVLFESGFLDSSLEIRFILIRMPRSQLGCGILPPDFISRISGRKAPPLFKVTDNTQVTMNFRRRIRWIATNCLLTALAFSPLQAEPPADAEIARALE